MNATSTISLTFGENVAMWKAAKADFDASRGVSTAEDVIDDIVDRLATSSEQILCEIMNRNGNPERSGPANMGTGKTYAISHKGDLYIAFQGNSREFELVVLPSAAMHPIA